MNFDQPDLIIADVGHMIETVRQTPTSH
jgi:hypothetical protein